VQVLGQIPVSQSILCRLLSRRHRRIELPELVGEAHANFKRVRHVGCCNLLAQNVPVENLIGAAAGASSPMTLLLAARCALGGCGLAAGALEPGSVGRSSSRSSSRSSGIIDSRIPISVVVVLLPASRATRRHLVCLTGRR
jgi:hypothetical protein